VLPVSLSFLYIAQRYASDLFPLLLLLAVGGFTATTTWLERRRVPWRRTIVVAAAVLVAIGCWTGIATALEYQRNLAPVVTTDLRRQYVDWQWRVADRLGFGTPEVRRGRRLPAPGARDSLFVIGPCDALYVSDGDGWRPVERANMGGHFRVTVDEGTLRVGGPITLVRSGSGADQRTVVLERTDSGHGFVREEHDGQRSKSFGLGDGTATYELVLDPRLHLLTVQRGDREVWSTSYDGPDGGFEAGADVRNLEVPTSVCRRALPHGPG
jgi:hypothetical protein